jgi:hypothetical protein
MYLCTSDKRAFAWYVYVYLYLEKIGFKIYIFENKGLWGFQIWIFPMHMCCITMHIRSLGDGGYCVSLIAKSGGPQLCDIIVEHFTLEFLQVPTSSYINLFRCIETFYIVLLAFDVIGVTWEFLQVQLAHLWILLLAFGVSVAWKPCIDFLLLLCESFCKLLHQPSMLLPLLVCQVFTKCCFHQA